MPPPQQCLPHTPLLRRLLLIVRVVSCSSGSALTNGPSNANMSLLDVSGYPVCGVSASFSAINGPAPIIGVHQGDPLVYCMGLCGDNPSCKAVSFISWSSTCTLYSRELRFIDLIEDTESEFEFYDYVCGESSTSNKRSTTTEVTVPADTTSDSPKIACMSFRLCLSIYLKSFCVLVVSD